MTLTCSDGTGAGCGNIYYTTNGSTPTPSSALYSGPITITPTATLKFFAVDLAGNSEVVKTETYVNTNLSPQTSANYRITSDVLNGGGGAGGSANYSMQRSSIGEPFAAGASSSGSYVDNAGTESTIDTTQPDTSITANPSNPSNSSSPSFSFNATETATFQCKLDSGSYASCTSPAKYLGLSDGSHTVYVKATDAAGNTDATPATYTWDIDGTAPTTTASPAGGTYTSSQSVTLTPNETATTYYCLGSGCTPTTVGTSVSISGSTVLRFYSKDTANNSEAVKTENYAIAAAAAGLNYTSGDTGSGGTDNLAGVTRSDYGNDADNLDSGKARFDVLYNFTILLVDDTGEIPQVEPKLYVAHKSSPLSVDFFKYDLTCTGSTWAQGKTCTAAMPLGPAAVTKYYFIATKTTGGITRLPSSGYLDGPTVKTLNGWAIVSAARDIDAATLSAGTALGNSTALEWVSTGLDAVYNSVFSGYWQTPSSIKKGKAYFINGGSGTLPELAGYSDESAANVEITLQQGWNLIATPYNGNVKLSNVFVRKGAGANQTWTTATSNNWVYNTLWNFNGREWGNTYRFDSAGGSPDAVLAPWMGYWIYLRVNDDTYTLVIPKPAQ